MKDDDKFTTFGALDPTRALSDEAIDELFPNKQLVKRIEERRNTSFLTSSPPRRERRRIATTSLVAVAASAVVFTFVSLSTTAVTRAVAKGVVIYGTPTSHRAGPSPTFGDFVTYGSTNQSVRWCSQRQLSVSLRTSDRLLSASSGWSGTFWIQNTGALCQIPNVDVGVQAVDVHKIAIGSGSVSDVVARRPMRIAHDQWAEASVSVSPTDSASPLGPTDRTIGQYCHARISRGLILSGFRKGWFDRYFALPAPIEVCTRALVNVAGSTLMTAPVR